MQGILVNHANVILYSALLTRLVRGNASPEVQGQETFESLPSLVANSAMEPRPETVNAYWQKIWDSVDSDVTKQEREVKTHFGVRETKTHEVARNRQDFEDTWNWQVCIEVSYAPPQQTGGAKTSVSGGGEHQRGHTTTESTCTTWKDAKEVCEYREHTQKYTLQGGEAVDIYQLSCT